MPCLLPTIHSPIYLFIYFLVFPAPSTLFISRTPYWYTADAETEGLFAGDPGLSKYLFVKPRLGQNIASRASHVAVSSSILINSADMIYSAHFPLNHKDKKSSVS